MPHEFRPITFYFDETDVHNAYKQLHMYKMHAREYLPLVWFLHRFPGYQFAWYVEYDVRYDHSTSYPYTFCTVNGAAD